jgi:hypothetical protein
MTTCVATFVGIDAGMDLGIDARSGVDIADSVADDTLERRTSLLIRLNAAEGPSCGGFDAELFLGCGAETANSIFGRATGVLLVSYEQSSIRGGEERLKAFVLVFGDGEALREWRIWLGETMCTLGATRISVSSIYDQS